MTVLAYHAVADCAPSDDPYDLVVPVDAFRGHLRYLAERGGTISLAQAVAGARGVAITFDDGYRSVLEVAGPLLQEYGMTATVFVPTGWLGRRNGWDDLPRGPFDIMTAGELRACEALGVAVETHGHDHISYRDSDAAVVERDLRASALELERIVGRRPRYLAYPFGPSSPAARAVARAQGIEAAFSIDAPHDGVLAFGRVAVKPGDSLTTFARKTSERYASVRHHPATAWVRAVTRPIRSRLGRRRRLTGR